MKFEMWNLKVVATMANELVGALVYVPNQQGILMRSLSGRYHTFGLPFEYREQSEDQNVPGALEIACDVGLKREGLRYSQPLGEVGMIGNCFAFDYHQSIAPVASDQSKVLRVLKAEDVDKWVTPQYVGPVTEYLAYRAHQGTRRSA